MAKKHVFWPSDPPDPVSTPHSVKQSCSKPGAGKAEKIFGGSRPLPGCLGGISTRKFDLKFGQNALKMASSRQFSDLGPQPRAFELLGGVEPVSRHRRPRKTPFYPIIQGFWPISGPRQGKPGGMGGQNGPKMVEKSILPNPPKIGFQWREIDFLTSGGSKTA